MVERETKTEIMAVEKQTELGEILKLTNDPIFAEFENWQREPSIFGAVGRTHTETWHSAFLGWLFDKDGNHDLGSFPLRRLLLLLMAEDELSAEARDLDFRQVVIVGDFSKVETFPSESNPREFADGKSRFDVFVRGISLPPDENSWGEVGLLVETKVESPISSEQCKKYVEFIKKQQAADVFLIPVYIAPTSQFAKDPKELFGDEWWIPLDYRQIFLSVIEPCLCHPGVSEFGKATLSQFIRAIKAYHLENDEPLIMTDKEKQLVRELWKRHRHAIRALYSVLAEEQPSEEFDLDKLAGKPKSEPIRILIAQTPIKAHSIRHLYLESMKLMHKLGKLDQVTPFPKSGTKQHLLSKKPVHPSGHAFWNEVEFNGYFMEANKSRATGLAQLKKLVEASGLTFQLAVQ